MKSPKQRSSSPVDAWMTILRGDTRDRLLGCFCTWESLPFWATASLFCVGTVGTGTGMGALGFFSSFWCVFRTFSLLSCATWLDGSSRAGSGLGVTFLALFLAELATSFFQERDTNIECLFRLLSFLSPSPASSASAIDAFFVAGDIERTVPMTAKERAALVADAAATLPQNLLKGERRRGAVTTTTETPFTRVSSPWDRSVCGAGRSWRLVLRATLYSNRCSGGASARRRCDTQSYLCSPSED